MLIDDVEVYNSTATSVHNCKHERHVCRVTQIRALRAQTSPVIACCRCDGPEPSWRILDDISVTCASAQLATEKRRSVWWGT
jgi:hypothetical protein